MTESTPALSRQGTDTSREDFCAYCELLDTLYFNGRRFICRRCWQEHMTCPTCGGSQKVIVKKDAYKLACKHAPCPACTAENDEKDRDA